MRLNYALIFQFLTSQSVVHGTDLADWLDMDTSIISKIKHNKRGLPDSITAEKFYDDVFGKKESLINYSGIKHLYFFLKSKACVNKEIEQAFKEYANQYDYVPKEKQVEIAKQFLMVVLNATSYDKNPDTNSEGKEPVNSLRSAGTNAGICFAKFRNPIGGAGSKFFGRQEMLRKIHEMLEAEGICIICGIGGLGKSYCSLKYALEYKDSYKQIQQVIFSGTMKSTLLKISFDGFDESHLTEDEKLENRFSVLSAFSEDTLLIVDNMDVILDDDDRIYYERLKALPIHVIVTTRETTIDAQKFQIPIEPLLKEEQLKLFQYYGQFEIASKDLPAYYELFAMVEGHTLLLELMAKTMAAETLTPQEMKEILDSPEDADISKIDIEKDNQYQQERMNQFVSKLFDTSQLSISQKDILMKLSLASVLGVRQRLLKKLLMCRSSDINALIHQSWIIQEHSGSADLFRIHLHPVIRSAVINNMMPTLDGCWEFISKIVSQIQECPDELSVDDKTDLCNILANASDMFSFGIKEIDFLFDMAKILWNNLFYSDSNKVCCIGIAILKKAGSEQCLKLIDFYEMAGKISVRLAKYEDAVRYYKLAEHLIQTGNENFEKLVLLYDKLGEVMRKSSNYEQALDYFTKAQNMLDVHQIDNPMLEANIYNDMGVIYINLDILDKALENYQKARKIRESISDLDNKAQIAYTYHNIGTVYQRQKKYDEAIEWHTKALNIRKEIYPENEPIIAASLTMLGNDYTEAAYNNSEKYCYETAWDFFEKGLKIREETLGENHPDTAWSHQSIGKWYFYQGKYEEALEHYQKCYSIRKIFLQENHAYIAEILYAIGQVYYALKDFQNAKMCLEHAGDIHKELHKTRAYEKTKQLLEKLEKISGI